MKILPEWDGFDFMAIPTQQILEDVIKVILFILSRLKADCLTRRVL